MIRYDFIIFMIFITKVIYFFKFESMYVRGLPQASFGTPELPKNKTK
jgi:hypothetical protein